MQAEGRNFDSQKGEHFITVYVKSSISVKGVDKMSTASIGGNSGVTVTINKGADD
jgi:hypothetical protein